jgi:hypothetical protein
MRNKFYWSPGLPRQTRSWPRLVIFVLVALGVFACAPGATARNAEAPPWMHALVNAPLPAHDEKTEAVLLYSETMFTVLSSDSTRVVVHRVYKILRPSGREYGTVLVPFNSRKKITSIHGWCIPAKGGDYEVKDKDAVEVALPKIEGSELISDVKVKLLRIPAPDPGNIVGYEYVAEERPLALQEVWDFQGALPVRESHYTLELPPGWECKAAWLNYPAVKPSQDASGRWQWGVSDVKAMRTEEDMPPMAGVAGKMVVTFFPSGGPGANSFANWNDMGRWYFNLTSGRREVSPEIKQKAAALAASAPTPLAKMQALAEFVQRDIRYVAIELGVGGVQPHPASEVFEHRYGDCKDKATLMASMLHEIGVDSYYVVINVDRGSVTPDTPPHLGAFDHALIAIRLPAGLTDPSLTATMEHPRLGKLLFFDPTSDLTPFGQIPGELQANYGLLVTPEGGELAQLPRQPSLTNGIWRTAKLTLNAVGTLTGDVEEVRRGDYAAWERQALLGVAKDTDRVKLIERLLADSLSVFKITKSTIIDLHETDHPLGIKYSFEAENYAKRAGNLLLVRPRVLGSKSSGLLETREARKFPVEFNAPRRDMDTFEITLPPGFEVADSPPDVIADYTFAIYHSTTQVAGNVVRYSRTFEVKELSVPVSKVEELKAFYRTIASDERNNVVLKPTSP